MSQGLLLREDVPVSETWDLVDLFKDDQQYYESIDALVQQANQFHHTYATTLNSIEQINTALAELENILIALDRLSNYAELRLSVDTSNIEAQVLSAKLSTTYGKIVSQLSFVESEILELTVNKTKAIPIICVGRTSISNFITYAKQSLRFIRHDKNARYYIRFI